MAAMCRFNFGISRIGGKGEPLMNIDPVLALPSVAEKKEKTKTGPAAAGKRLFQETLQKVNQQQLNAEKAVQELTSGKIKDLHQVMIATEQARLSLQLTMQVTSKVVEAYKEITRIQI